MAPGYCGWSYNLVINDRHEHHAEVAVQWEWPWTREQRLERHRLELELVEEDGRPVDRREVERSVAQVIAPAVERGLSARWSHADEAPRPQRKPRERPWFERDPVEVNHEAETLVEVELEEAPPPVPADAGDEPDAKELRSAVDLLQDLSRCSYGTNCLHSIAASTLLERLIGRNPPRRGAGQLAAARRRLERDPALTELVRRLSEPGQGRGERVALLERAEGERWNG